jgi:hypothetical protein
MATESGSLDNKMREGGWGAVSGVVADQTNFPMHSAKPHDHRRRSRSPESTSHHAVIRVYDDAGNVIEAHEHAGDFKEW